MDQNKPYESIEAIQFHKIKASALLQQQQQQQPSSFFSINRWWNMTQPGTDRLSSHHNDATDGHI